MNRTLDPYKLKIAMQLENLTAKELADKAGVSESSIHQYVGGHRTPSLEHFARLCKALNVEDAGSLLKREGEELLAPENEEPPKEEKKNAKTK